MHFIYYYYYKLYIIIKLIYFQVFFVLNRFLEEPKSPYNFYLQKEATFTQFQQWPLFGRFTVYDLCNYFLIIIIINVKNNILKIVIIYIIICYIRGNYVEAFSTNFFQFLPLKGTNCDDEIYATLCRYQKRIMFV